MSMTELGRVTQEIIDQKLLTKKSKPWWSPEMRAAARRYEEAEGNVYQRSIEKMNEDQGVS